MNGAIMESTSARNYVCGGEIFAGDGDHTHLKDAIELEPRLKEMMEKPSVVGQVDGRDVTTREVLEISLAPEGLHRQAGIHAAGVVIADSLKVVRLKSAGTRPLPVARYHPA